MPKISHASMWSTTEPHTSALVFGELLQFRFTGIKLETGISEHVIIFLNVLLSACCTFVDALK